VLYLAFVYGLRILGRFRRKEMLPIVALLLVAAGASVAFAISNPALLLESIGRSDGLSGRTQIWNAVLASILHRPIGGYGYDAFWSLPQGEVAHIFAAAGWVVTSAHNGFLNVFLELGLIGIVLVAGTFLQAFRDASRVFHPGHSRYVDWCIGIVFLTLLYNLDERTLMATQYLPWVLYIVACTGLSESARATLQLPTPLASEARA
jgi:exopolysaccharide production protein ExoQ